MEGWLSGYCLVQDHCVVFLDKTVYFHNAKADA